MFTRLSTAVLILVYLLMWQHYGIYMLTYTNYLGEMILTLLIGNAVLALDTRFASLFLLFWLTLSLFYFGETVWPHIILAGVAIAIFMHGYDKYTVQFGLMRMRYRGLKEPVP